MRDLIYIGVIFVFVFAFVGIVRDLRRSGYRSRRALAATLHGRAIPGGVRGTYAGVPVSLHYTSTIVAGVEQRWTYIESPLPPRYPFAVYLRGHRYEDALDLERGALVDVKVGEPAFDEVFLVEGAPAEIVLRVLDHRVRELLVQRPPLKIDTTAGVLQLVVGGWLEDRAILAPWFEVVTKIAGGVSAAHGEADAAVPLVGEGGAYRGIPDERPLHAARAARADEVQRLGAMRRARAPDATMAIIAVAVLVGLPLVYLLVTGQ